MKSHSGMGVLLYIYCIFSECLFLRTPLDGCFWTCYLRVIIDYTSDIYSMFLLFLLIKHGFFPFNDSYILIKSSVSVVSDAEQCFNLWPSLRPYPLLTTLLVTKSIHSCKMNSRSNLPKVFCKKSVLKNFANISGKKTCQSLFYKKVANL